MRKTLALFIVVFISVLFLYASPYSGNDISGNTSLTLSSDLTTIFKQGSTDVKNSLAIGYTLNKQTVTGETITPIDNTYKLTLTESYIGSNAKATGSIYAFFRVASLDAFKVSLTWSSLTNTADSSKTINLKINNKTSGSIFYTFNPSNGVMDDYRLLLEFATEEYLNSAHVGTYETTITMSITSGA
ncbi:MAG: hypothetical protein MSS69_00690 [Spirochaetales bacterium]|nr:hypothetical protein [Spirochaetales bacterium]